MSFPSVSEEFFTPVDKFVNTATFVNLGKDKRKSVLNIMVFSTSLGTN